MALEIFPWHTLGRLGTQKGSYKCYKYPWYYDWPHTSIHGYAISDLWRLLSSGRRFFFFYMPSPIKPRMTMTLHHFPTFSALSYLFGYHLLNKFLNLPLLQFNVLSLSNSSRPSFFTVFSRKFNSHFLKCLFFASTCLKTSSLLARIPPMIFSLYFCRAAYLNSSYFFLWKLSNIQCHIGLQVLNSKAVLLTLILRNFSVP